MRKLFVLILFVALSSCAFQSYYPQTGSIMYEPVAVETVKIYPGDIEEDYIILGSIAADAAGNGKKAKSLLQKRAAALGADAVIKTELTKVGSFFIRTGISGVAVRLK